MFMRGCSWGEQSAGEQSAGELELSTRGWRVRRRAWTGRDLDMGRGSDCPCTLVISARN